MNTRLFVLTLFAAFAAATVIQTDAQVVATVSVQSNADVNAFHVITLLNRITAFGFQASANNNGNNGNSSVSASFATSYAGIFPVVGLDWGHFESSSYFNIGEGTAAASSSAIFASFHPLALVQYVDQNNNNQYDQGEEYALTFLGGRFYKATSTRNTVGDSKTSVWTNSYNSDVFGFRWTVSNRPTKNQGVSIDADSMKIDIWIRPPTPTKANGKVALITTFSMAQADASMSGSASGGNVTLNGQGSFTYTRNGKAAGLTWADTAKVSYGNGNTDTVKVTTNVIQPSGEAKLIINGQTVADAKFGNLGRFFVFNYDAVNPTEIYWDPTLGTGSASTLIVSISVALFAVLLL